MLLVQQTPNPALGANSVLLASGIKNSPVLTKNSKLRQIHYPSLTFHIQTSLPKGKGAYSKFKPSYINHPLLVGSSTACTWNSWIAITSYDLPTASQVRLDDDSAESTDRTEGKATAKPTVTPHQMRKFVERGIERTKKEASVKQELDRGLQAVQAVMGIVDTAIRAAPEAAVIWATVCLGIEVLKNPITEALENRQGIHLLLDENKKNTAATVLRDALEESITQLFQQLLSYQIRSICLYRRNKVVGFIRDVFLIDDWAGQVNGIKEAEKAVQHDIEQYNTQESQQQMQKLNDSTAAMQANVANIHTAVQSLAEQQAKAREDDKNNECLRVLCVTDPRMDKKNIENKKGGLLRDSYKWILEHQGFKKFKNEADSRILWIKGDPGKGKTMLLCGIINELEEDQSTSPCYFFCQDTGGSRLNTATSVLRGLVYHLTQLKPRLIKHVRKVYDCMGNKLFENENTWYHISQIATAMLEDPSMKNAILIVDALDECVVDQKLLLDFITGSSAVKWIVSSRNRPKIEESLNDATQKVKIHLEINQSSVSLAVDFFMKYKVDQLVVKKKYDDKVKMDVLEHLQSNANGTFLWVALVCQELSNSARWEAPAKLKSFPPGLDALYRRMLDEISKSSNAQLYKEIIAKVLIAYRPITLDELRVLVKALEDFNREDIEGVIASCGSLFTVHDNVVSFVHQSAKDYFLGEALGQVLPFGISHQHQVVLVRSLELLHQTLKRDIYNLQAPGCLISEISAAPDPDPLAGIQYSCIFWVDHLHDSSANVIASENDKILAFFKEKYLQWLEALSLMGNIYTGVRAIGKLGTCLQGKASTELQDIVKDASRFLLSNTGRIETAPMQVYASALVFSPTNSIIRRIFTHEEPDWIKIKPRVEADWDACLQTLEGHVSSVLSVVFSYDGQRLASGSYDKTVKIWDATSGACLQTLTDYGRMVTPEVFSNNEQRIASEPSASKSPLFHSKSYTFGGGQDSSWIMENRQRVLWMPPSYRPIASAASHAKLGLATASGRIILMGFESGGYPKEPSIK
ncbi:Vegetative incompatibility protein HET-E-1 [Ceratocystis lukuohia]|uniref:Vegetative incompatibility protein HET-E-1 n=1 Tax=Ceratocystis lukuohia TaxID=2019550 RepID=A0ABR4MKU1_9PEZI